MAGKARLVIADQQRLFAEACKQILEPEFEVVATVNDGRSLVQAATEHKPDALILDVTLPQLNGIDAAEQVIRMMPAVKILFTTANADPEVAAEAFRLGASAYVLKQSGTDEYLTAIRKVMRGDSYLSSLIARETIDYLLRRPKRENLRRITRRQSEILQLLAEGKSMKAVANLLDISPGTVAFHKYDMMERLGIETNAGLLQYAMRNSMIPVERDWTVMDSSGARSSFTVGHGGVAHRTSVQQRIRSRQ
jgi:DNA-binding NarL/FixJ family response regulator